MKVSIITTVYKAEKDLPRLLDSMMAQKSPELEFFLIDNGSPDGCGEICRQYAALDSRFTVFTIKENIGYIHARNVGIKECSGDYIGFCDSDDYLEEGGYDKAIKKIKETDCDLYITAYRTVSENSQSITLMPYKAGLYEGDKVYTGILPQAFGHLEGKSALHGFAWKQIFRRNIIIDNQFEFMPTLQPYEDQMFNIDVIRKCNKVYIDENVIYNYIVNQQSITAKLVSSFDAVAEWERISLLYGEKKRRCSETVHQNACANQAVGFIYSMVLNIAKSKKTSLFKFPGYFKKVVDRKVLEDIICFSTSALSKRNAFLKNCLKKRRYFLLFFVTRMGLVIKGKR